MHKKFLTEWDCSQHCIVVRQPSLISGQLNVSHKIVGVKLKVIIDIYHMLVFSKSVSDFMQNNNIRFDFVYLNYY